MKRLLIICMMTCGFIISSCHQDEDSLFAEASIVLQGETDIVLDKVQGTVSLTNLNSTQVFTVSSFEGNIARASILRGSYAILVEGTAQYLTLQVKPTSGCSGQVPIMWDWKRKDIMKRC